jgi:hypothetical protein
MMLCLIGAMVAAQGEKRVTIEVKEAPVAEAFDQLFRAAGENFVLMPGVPSEQRLTLRLVDVPFEKALSFLCDVAGLKWERKDGTYLISPIPRPPAPPGIPMPPFGAPPGVGAMGGAWCCRAFPCAECSRGDARKLLEFRFPDEFAVSVRVPSPKLESLVRPFAAPSAVTLIRFAMPAVQALGVAQLALSALTMGRSCPLRPKSAPSAGRPCQSRSESDWRSASSD